MVTSARAASMIAGIRFTSSAEASRRIRSRACSAERVSWGQAPGPVFDGTAGGAPPFADLAQGTKVTVWTSPTELALETQLARPGVLSAARVAVRS